LIPRHSYFTRRSWLRFSVLAGLTLALNPTALVAGEIEVEGKFNLVDQWGKARTEQDLRGKPTILFFGYTHCPDFCPTALQDLALLMRDMKQEADAYHFVFISVDPERDKPEILRDFLGSFDSRILGLTGTANDVEQALDSFMAFAQRVNYAGSYVFDHSSLIYLFDAKGHFEGRLNLSTGLPEQKIQLARLK
jgi:protein SCO1/2